MYQVKSKITFTQNDKNYRSLNKYIAIKLANFV